MIIKTLCLILFAWAIVATTLLIKKTDGSFSRFFSQSSRLSPSKKSLHKEYTFLKKTLKNYYVIPKNFSPEKKLALIQKKIDKADQKLEEAFLSEYRSTLNYFSQKQGVQKLKIHKILRDKITNQHVAFLHIEQIMPKEKPLNYLIELRLSLFNKNGVLKVSHWKETILTPPSKLYSDLQLYLSPQTTAYAALPCKVLSLTKIDSNQNVEMKLSANSRGVSFKTSQKINQPSKVRANCSLVQFTFTLKDDEKWQTLYQTWALEDGLSENKKLTPTQKLHDQLKKQLGITVTK